MNFLELPPEMLSYVLQQLTVHDLLSCRETCTSLREITDSSIALQYNIELGASDKIDNSGCSLSRSAKLVELRRSNTSWSRLHWTHRIHPIPIRNYAAVYELSGGCFFQDMNPDFTFSGRLLPSTLSWLKLPSQRNSKVGKWKEAIFDFKVADLCLDVDRDLIAVVERRDTPGHQNWSVNCVVHLRTISTNETHPDASKSVLCVRFTAPNSDYAMIVQLSGNHLAILLSTRHLQSSRFDMFYLWDWTTGDLKACMSSSHEQWDTFCFLSDNAILIPDTNFGSLNIYLFDSTPSSFRHAVSLLLPDTVNTPAIAHISSRTEPPSRPSAKFRQSSSSTDAKPFKTDPDSSVVIFTFDYIVTPRQGNIPFLVQGFAISILHPQVVAIKRKTLLDYAVRAELSLATMRSKMKMRDSDFQSALESPASSTASSSELPKPPINEPVDVFALDSVPPEVHANSSGLFEIPSEDSSFPNDDPETSFTVPLPSSSQTTSSSHSESTEDPFRKRVPHIHAEHWIHSTRWGLGPVPPRWVCYAHGSRYISMEDRPFGSSKKMGFAVYDFNVKPVRRELCALQVDAEGADGADEPEGAAEENGDEEDDEQGSDREHVSDETPQWPVKRMRIIDTPSIVNLPDIFKHEFRTALPYRVTESKEAFDWDSVMIDDERVIGLKEEENDLGGLECLDVLVL